MFWRYPFCCPNDGSYIPLLFVTTNITNHEGSHRSKSENENELSESRTKLKLEIRKRSNQTFDDGIEGPEPSKKSVQVNRKGSGSKESRAKF